MVSPETTAESAVIDAARELIAAAPKQLRRLADEIEQLPTDRTLDVHIALDSIKKGADRVVTNAKKQIGDRDQGVMSELLTEFADRGVSSERHAHSGRLAYINNRIFAGTRDGVERAAAAEAMQQVDELADFVEPAFNLNSVSSYFREQVKELEAQGVPITDEVLADLIPAELREFIELKPSPVIAVRS